MSQNLPLIKGDLKMIGRDPMLILCLVAPLLIMMVAVFLFPLVSDLTNRFLNFPLDTYFSIGKLFLFPLTPMMLGLIYGFILLDERDGGIISYLAITPLGKSGYLKIRMMMPVIVSFLLSLVFLVVTGFGRLINGLEMISLSIITAFEAPMMLLFLAAFASNKVEGIAISKGFAIIMLPMVIDYFLKGDWRWLLSVSPLWWIERAIFSDISIRWIYLAGAAIVHFCFIWFLYRKFEKRVG